MPEPRFFIIWAPALSGFDFAATEQVEAADTFEEAVRLCEELSEAFHCPLCAFTIYDSKNPHAPLPFKG